MVIHRRGRTTNLVSLRFRKQTQPFFFKGSKVALRFARRTSALNGLYFYRVFTPFSRPLQLYGWRSWCAGFSSQGCCCESPCLHGFLHAAKKEGICAVCTASSRGTAASSEMHNTHTTCRPSSSLQVKVLSMTSSSMRRWRQCECSGVCEQLLHG